MEPPTILTNKTFDWLKHRGLCSSTTVDALRDMGYSQLTTIQYHSMPKLLTKQNVFLHARTGSGKTLAFLIPAVERLKAMNFHSAHGVGVLIVSPTRELALQTASVLSPLIKAHALSSATLVGGTKLQESLIKEGAVIVVATLGKLLEALGDSSSSYALPVHKLRILILDEADRILDDGAHTQSLRKIVSKLPLDKVQKVLVSATQSTNCTKLSREIFDAEFTIISVEQEQKVSTKHIKQNYIKVMAEDRLALLITVIRTLKNKKIIVFFNSSHSVKFHYQICLKMGLDVIHSVGQNNQEKRCKAYIKFCKLKQGALLTTGLAERGWDIPGVQWIVQYDPPHKPQDYIHRVGRTGRGEGNVGQAVLFLRPEEEEFVSILKGMNVEIDLLEFQGRVEEIKSQVQDLVKDTELNQSAQLAYKKFVRAYQCHNLRKIFNIKNLDLSKLCISFGFSVPPMELGHLS
ncbi:uncharacterized protein LOC143029752 [Oratosquilla oratoria]|uniref:uncharacterized protein LOC143029752 n=1 Tax=Oratosquilla oratoria TaxID=337810 RepID=UPI003F777C1F